MGLIRHRKKRLLNSKTAIKSKIKYTKEKKTDKKWIEHQWAVGQPQVA